MIQKIVSISHVGRFASYKSKGLTNWKPLTLIFAENGRGKTTFTAVLRSNSENDAPLLLGRTTLGQVSAPEIEILAANGTLRFTKGTWTGTSLNMHIFDAHFVQTNVHEGDHVETEHRRNLFNVIVGEVGRKLNEEISDLDDQVRSVTKEIGGKRSLLEKSLKGQVSIAEFFSIEADPIIEVKIIGIRKELAALNNMAAIEKGPVLDPLTVLSFPSGYSHLLEKTLEDLSIVAVAKVSAHLQSHDNENFASWLMSGVGFVESSNCPFCMASLEHNDLVEAYSS